MGNIENLNLQSRKNPIIPTSESIDLARRLKLVLTIDDKRKADDPLKLFPALRMNVVDEAKDLEDADGITGSPEAAPLGMRTRRRNSRKSSFSRAACGGSDAGLSGNWRVCLCET